MSRLWPWLIVAMRMGVGMGMQPVRPMPVTVGVNQIRPFEQRPVAKHVRGDAFGRDLATL